MDYQAIMKTTFCSTGECPDNHRPGDKWQAGGCTEKVCDEHGYATYG